MRKPHRTKKNSDHGRLFARAERRGKVGQQEQRRNLRGGFTGAWLSKKTPVSPRNPERQASTRCSGQSFLEKKRGGAGGDLQGGGAKGRAEGEALQRCHPGRGRPPRGCQGRCQGRGPQGKGGSPPAAALPSAAPEEGGGEACQGGEVHRCDLNRPPGELARTAATGGKRDEGTAHGQTTWL